MALGLCRFGGFLWDLLTMELRNQGLRESQQHRDYRQMDLTLECTLEVKKWGEVVKRREKRKRGARVLQRERMGTVLGLLMNRSNPPMMENGGEGEIVEVVVEAAAEKGV